MTGSDRVGGAEQSPPQRRQPQLLGVTAPTGTAAVTTAGPTSLVVPRLAIPRLATPGLTVPGSTVPGLTVVVAGLAGLAMSTVVVRGLIVGGWVSLGGFAFGTVSFGTAVVGLVVCGLLGRLAGGVAGLPVGGLFGSGVLVGLLGERVDGRGGAEGLAAQQVQGGVGSQLCQCARVAGRLRGRGQPVEVVVGGQRPRHRQVRPDQGGGGVVGLAQADAAVNHAALVTALRRRRIGDDDQAPQPLGETE